MREVSVGQGSCTGENAKIKVSAFFNFEIGHLKKKMMIMKKSVIYKFPCTVVAVDFT